MNRALAGYLDVFVVAYLDDIIVYSSDEKEHVSHVRSVLSALRNAGLYLKLPKCQFHTRDIEFLGYHVSTEGVRMEQDRVQVIRD